MKIASALTVVALAASLAVVPASLAAQAGKVATVGERTITRAELEDHVRAKLIELENQRYETLREGLDEMIAKVTEPTDAEIQKVYDDNKAQLGSQTLEQVRPRIVEYLKQQRAEQGEAAFVADLKKKH